MAASVPREGFERRLEQLLLERDRLEGRIEEVRFWIARCVEFEEQVAEGATDG